MFVHVADDLIDGLRGQLVVPAVVRPFDDDPGFAIHRDNVAVVDLDLLLVSEAGELEQRFGHALHALGIHKAMKLAVFSEADRADVVIHPLAVPRAEFDGSLVRHGLRR